MVSGIERHTSFCGRSPARSFSDARHNITASCTHLAATHLQAQRPCRWVDVDLGHVVSLRGNDTRPNDMAADQDDWRWREHQLYSAHLACCPLAGRRSSGSVPSSFYELAVPVALTACLSTQGGMQNEPTAAVLHCRAHHVPSYLFCSCL